MRRMSWSPTRPPVSFRYGQRDSGDLLGTWQHIREALKGHGGRLVRHVYTESPAGLGVTVTLRRFKGFDALDWVVELENLGAADTPILQDILPLDTTFAISPRENAYLHCAKGSQCAVDDFLPMTHQVGPRGQWSLEPVGGRSSNGMLPFMNLFHRDGGLVLAVGWSGQWRVTVQREGRTLRLTAGMQKTHLRLRPGEKIRTPRILVVNYSSEDPEEGNNLLRRLLIAHYLPRIGGELFLPPVAHCLQAYYYLTGDMSERVELEALPKAADLGATAYWIDACWYGQGRSWWEEVGNWTINRKRYPRGLKPIADAAHARGMKFVLWFEPARVRQDSDLAREHPDYVLRCPQDPAQGLLDFGNPEARQHILEVFSRIIAESGVDVYREDFNFDPLPYWQAADAPDRQGMTEIRFIEGHYAFWDELRRRFGHLAIDNCASGGRRIALESLSRSLPLWPSDFLDVVGLPWGPGLHVGSQCIKAGLARWVPLFAGGLWSFEPYAARSALLGGFVFGPHIRPQDFPSDADGRALTHRDVLAKGHLVHRPKFPTRRARAAIAEWRSLREFFLGDFHLLLPLTASAHDWCAYQLHRPDMDAGFALFFRRHRSPFESMDVRLKGVKPSGRYQVSLASAFKAPPPRSVSGGKLARMTVRIPKKPGSMLLRYSRGR
jgi:alpha-galactosidase